MKKLILLLFIPLISFSQNEDILLNGSVSAEGNQIKNLADPTDDQDAVTLAFLMNKLSEFQAQIDALESSENVTTEYDEFTTLNVYFDGALTLSYQDLDGSGPDIPVITSSPLFPFTTYNVNLEFLNELNEPAENYTYEINEENLDYQIFVSLNNGSDVYINNFNLDENGNILGTQFQLTTGSVGEGTITITLVHEPLKPNDGLESAGGDIDIQATFDVLVYN